MNRLNKRRNLVIALGASAVLLPLVSFAQQGKIWRVGFLAERHVDYVDSDYYYGPFREGMRELGYVEGKNLVIEWRSADDKVERLPGLATELVNLKMDVIVTAGGRSTSAVQKATTNIPIVMLTGSEPVGAGFVKSLARPGGNITGLSAISVDICPKLLEMLRSMVPKVSRVALLMNPDNLFHTAAAKSVQAAAQGTGVTILYLAARDPQEIENAFSQMARQKTGGLIVMRDAIFNRQVRQIADLAAKNRLPTIAEPREYVEAGGLVSYGANIAGQYRRAATYVDKIVKGAKPADLPVEQPTKFELFINRKTAEALGLTIPQSLLISADKVLE